MPSDDCDYVVVGSGAGGGTLAARLAEAGCASCCSRPAAIRARALPARLPDDYDVPAFHAFACENPAMRWDFFVRHYADEEQQRERPEATGRTGVLYPRAGTLGGCTAHNAMIFMPPHDADWDDIAAITGDASGAPRDMRRYFQRLEDCRHRPAVARRCRTLGIDTTGHGWDGWLRTEKSMPRRGVRATAAAGDSSPSPHSAPCAGHRGCASTFAGCVQSRRPQRPAPGAARRRGLCYTPLGDRRHARIGTRERLLDVAGAPSATGCTSSCDALATRVLFDGDKHARPASSTCKASACTARIPVRPAVPVSDASVRARARGDPGGRRVQHAATADAVRHRAARIARTPRHCRAA